MRIHCIMHVAEEGPAAIGHWAGQNDCELSFTRLFNAENFPSLESFDMLLVMGGPMSYDDDELFEWLAPEKAFIREAIEADKKVMGICLGAQIIAEALGSAGQHSNSKEIGWFPIVYNQEVLRSMGVLNPPKSQIVFHWHGDTFEIPDGAEKFASSNEFPNQAYLFNKRVVGLQFHLEANNESVETMVNAFNHELIRNTYIQTAEDILSQKDHIRSGNRLLFQILDYLKDPRNF